MKEFTHISCENCGIAPAIREALYDATTTTNDGHWMSADILCARCRLVIATVFKKRANAALIDDDFGNR